MSNQPIERSINPGGRTDINSKMYGGIYFGGNTAQATTVGAADTWLRIGNGNANHPLYDGIFPTFANPYWRLSGATTATQVLTFDNGKESQLTLHWGASFVCATASNFLFKLVRVPEGDLTAAEDVVGTINGTSVAVANFRTSFRHSMLVTVSPRDAFYIAFQNNTGAHNTTFISSELMFTQ